MDSYALEKFLSKVKNKTIKKVKYIKDKYFLTVYLHSLYLFSIFDKMSKNGFSEYFKKVDISELITYVFKPYSSFLLYENYEMEREILDSEDED